MNKQIRFVNLHHHSTFSHGDGHRTPAHHVERAVELGYSAIALTEHGSVSSHFQLEKHALKAGIKPIFGLEAYTGATKPSPCIRCDGTGHTGMMVPLIDLEGNELGLDDTCPVCRGTGIQDKQQYKYHLTIIARTQDGYRNLNRIVTQSWRDYYYHPTVSGGSLAANSGGLVILSGCTGSLLACSLTGGKGIPNPPGKDGYDWDAARLVIDGFQSMRHIGEWYFLEVQPFYELEKTCKINPAYERLSRELDVPLVVTCDVHYPRPEDGEMQAILHAVHRGKHSVDDVMREWNYQVPLTLPESDKDLGERLVKTGLSREAAWDAIENSAWIAEQCNVTLPKADRLRYPISEDDLKSWR